MIGEFEVRLDDKNRLRLPIGLLRQLGEDIKLGLVINRGMDSCLQLFPQKLWDFKTNEVNQLNHYVEEERDFMRYFYRGASRAEIDASSRILIPKLLLEHASIKQDVIINAYGKEIEIWSKEIYQKIVSNEPTNSSAIAQKIFGRKDA
ncbi:MAG: division/cell wall cluster transcriptional repressor MraZ [Saprospiraceae bacterium]